MSYLTGERSLNDVRNLSSLSATGELLVNGVEFDSNAALPLYRDVAFVPQHDSALGTLTIAETVWFSAALHLPSSSREEVAARVDHTLRLLDLSHVADRRMDVASGGERRRVSVAAELVTGASILLADEPTSGLDATCAQHVMTCLRSLASTGMGILVVIHAPSRSVFFSCDRIIMLAEGRVVCQGPPGDIVSRLNRAGLACPPDVAFPDHLLDQISMPESVALLRKGESGGDEDLFDATDVICKRDSASSTAEDDQASLLSGHWTTELRLLAWREALFHARAPSTALAHLVLATLLGVWMGLIYFHLSADLQGIQNRAGLLFFSVCSFGFSSLSAAEGFFSQGALVARERYRYYAPLSHFVVRLAVDFLLLRLIPVLIYSAILYPMAGLNAQPNRFGIFFLGLALLSTATSGIAATVAAVTRTPSVCALLLVLILLQSAIFGGFLSNSDALPAYVSWIPRLSTFNYAFQSLFANELSGKVLSFGLPGFLGGVQVPMKGSSILSGFANAGAALVPLQLGCLTGLLCFFVSLAALLHTLRFPPPWHGLRRRRRSAGGAEPASPAEGHQVELGRVAVAAA